MNHNDSAHTALEMLRQGMEQVLKELEEKKSEMESHRCFYQILKTSGNDTVTLVGIAYDRAMFGGELDDVDWAPFDPPNWRGFRIRRIPVHESRDEE